MHTVRFIGPGRAGTSLASALAHVGWDVVGTFGRGEDPKAAAHGVDVLVVATPDDAVARVAASVEADPATVVLHLSGSLGLDVLAPHPRRAALHPLVPLPDPADGARRLLAGVTFAVAGDALAREIASDLGGRAVEVADEDRAAYHAAACIAANHVVALLGQVERVAATAGLDLDAFLGLTRAAVDDVARLGPRRALTGPAVRGDFATLARHRDALAPGERPAYNAGVGLALQLAEGDRGPGDRSAGRTTAGVAEVRSARVVPEVVMSEGWMPEPTGPGPVERLAADEAVPDAVPAAVG
ncbi:MAG TPA: DUF2520 domain-containing protein [Acidimicrobiales bacterium]|nr:DUF2520 domain-containing protein [Acidimicrobiales bacterium]